jgi:hypothetical protein
LAKCIDTAFCPQNIGIAHEHNRRVSVQECFVEQTRLIERASRFDDTDSPGDKFIQRYPCRAVGAGSIGHHNSDSSVQKAFSRWAN